MPYDFLELALELHPPGSGRVWVNPSSGLDSNPGTEAQPKQSVAGALAAMSGGGIVWLADGDYGYVSISGRNHAENNWLWLVAQNERGAKFASPGGDTDAMAFANCSYVGVYGVEARGVDSPTTQGADAIVANGNVHHWAVWRCHAYNGPGAGIGGVGNGGSINNVSICYNTVHTCGRYLDTAGSAIGMFQFDRRVGSVSHTWIDNAWDNVVVGNVCYDNRNDPSTAATDGNGIIIDDMRNTQAYGGPAYGIPYTGNWLLLGNLSLDNGGTGVHCYLADDVTMLFNTVAHNCTLLVAEAGDLSQNTSNGSRADYNLAKAHPTRSNWMARYLSDAAFSQNCTVGGNGSLGTSTRNRTSESFNYFVSSSPTLAPLTDALADQWRPDGGTGAVERVTLSEADYAKVSRWPTLLGQIRPARTDGWAIGALEPSSSTPGTTVTHPYTAPSSGAGTVVSQTAAGYWPVATGGGGGSGGGGGATLPGAGLNSPGVFSGRILMDDAPLQGCVVKVVNAYCPGWPRIPVLDTLGGDDGTDVLVTQTDANGDWRVSGLAANKSWMLKIFPPSRCSGFGEVDAKYITGETGYIDTDGNNFMSTRNAPSSRTYNVYSSARFLFDMPCHVYPAGGGALQGSLGYSDLNVRFYTRNNFATSYGTQTGCTPGGGGGGGGGSTPTATVVSYTYRMTGIDGSIVNARAHAVIPIGTAPSGGRHVIAACHSADGLEQGGGVTPDKSIVDLDALIAANYVVVFVDNEGLRDAETGNTLPNPYINRKSAGRGVIDAVRAVGALTTISGHAAAWGWSQGGATALAAGELRGEGYGSDLHQMLAVAVDAVHPESFVSGYYNSGWATSYCVGICMGAWYEGRTLPLGQILDASSASSIASGAWDNYDVESLPGSFTANPTSVASWQTALRSNSFGYTKSPPVLLMPASSGIDGGYVASDTYVTRAQSQGTLVTRTNLTADHSGAPAAAASGARTWIASNIASEYGPTVVPPGSTVASFTFTPDAPMAGQTVTFTDTSAGNGAGYEVVSRSWAFGDGGSSTSQNPTRAYATAGVYAVQLTVNNARGETFAASRQVTVDVYVPKLTLQAELGTITSGYPTDQYAAHTISDNGGYNGTGYLGFFGLSGEKVVWNAVLAPDGAGSYKLNVRYRTAVTGVTRTLWVNGTEAATVTLAKNVDAWESTSWATVTATVVLNASANTIELRHAGDPYSYVDIDQIELVPSGARGPLEATLGPVTFAATGVYVPNATGTFASTLAGASVSATGLVANPIVGQVTAAVGGVALRARGKVGTREYLVNPVLYEVSANGTRVVNVLGRFGEVAVEGTVLKSDGVYVVVDHPTVAQLAAANEVYLGGHLSELTDDQADALRESGFQTRVE